MPGALDGIRVIDFGQYIAGPLAGMLLADQGADVIRVDPPGGPLLDVPANATWNRGKRSIALDLHDPADAATAFRLAAGADVVLENARPGALARFGLGADALRAANPALVHLSMPGFAASDSRRDLPAWEGVVSAAASLYTRPGDPVFTAIPIASSYAAFLGVDAVVMALIARGRDGVGQAIEVPLYDASFAAIGYRAQRRHNGEPASALGISTGPAAPWFGPHLGSDGRWVYFHIGNKNAKDFIDAAGAAQWWNAPDAPERIEALFATRTAQEWEDLGARVGTEMAVCTTSEEWLHHPHAVGASMAVDVPDRRLGMMRQPGVAVRLSATPGAVRSPAPQLDADRAAITAEAEAPPRTAPAAGSGGSPGSGTGGAPLGALHGVRVLDLCIVLAGPTCGRTLAEYGADVIKIDGPPRAGALGSGGSSDVLTAFNIEVNRGKRSIQLDLTTPEGQERFWALVDGADVVVENYRHGVVDRLGIGYEQVRARRPDIIYASLNAYGYEGPWAGRPGHEQLGQSVTGMSLRFGADAPPVLQPVAVNDFGTGFMGAYAVGLALLHRQRTGEGQWVNGALAYTACTLQSLYMQDYPGKRWDEPRGQDAPGWGPLQRIYRGSDGPFFLGARPDQRAALAALAGLDPAGLDPADGAAADQRLGEALAGAFGAAPAAQWVDRAREAGIGAHELRTVRQIMDDPWARQRGLSITREHAGIGLVDTVGAVPQLSGTPLVPGRPAPMRDADAAEILQQLRESAAAPSGAGAGQEG
ncbi:MAG: CoA transferase [Frankiaceae bacterium]|jgi:crotonobetainyl-CoA:carnitine CoA-transferase CaiB-like acyl-CoA transferase|nr:CoA transferase [Frankiaceae bacterium]